MFVVALCVYIDQVRAESDALTCLLTQAKRLEWLAQRRFEGLGGEAAVETGPENGNEIQKDD